MANITGTIDDDIIDNTTTGNDTVDAQDGWDTIYGSSGVDSIDGGIGNDQLVYFLSNNTYFNTISGPRTFTITDTSVSDSSGDITTTMANIEQVSISTVGLPLLPAGQGYTLDASAFTGWDGVSFEVFGTDDTLIGSVEFDQFSVRGGDVDVTGGDGRDRLQIGLIGSGAETATFTVNGSGDLVMSSTSGASVTSREVEIISIYGSTPTAKTVDWSATSIGMGWRPIPDAASPTIDTITGGSGNDGFEFSYGADVLTSGDGYDGFTVQQLWDPVNNVGAAFDGATITDFGLTDLLVFWESYTFIREDAFSGTAGEIRYEHVGATTIIESDGDGDGTADATLTLSNGAFTLRDGVLVDEFEEPFFGIQIVPLIEGTTDGDLIGIDFNGAMGVSRFDDHVDALGGDDQILGTGGRDVIDGGQGFDMIAFTPRPNSSLYNLPSGQRTFVIGASSVADDTGIVDTTFSGIEFISFDMTRLTNGGGHTLDANGFTGVAGVQVTIDAADTIIGSNQNDDFIVVFGGGRHYRGLR